MALFDHGPKGLDQVPERCRNFRGMSYGKQLLLHEVRLPASFGKAHCRKVHSNKLFAGNSMAKMRLEVEKVVEVIDSHLVVIRYNSGLSKAWKSTQNIKTRENL